MFHGRGPATPATHPVWDDGPYAALILEDDPPAPEGVWWPTARPCGPDSAHAGVSFLRGPDSWRLELARTCRFRRVVLAVFSLSPLGDGDGDGDGRGGGRRPRRRLRRRWWRGQWARWR